MKVFFQNNNESEGGLFWQIERACEGLVYISETDAPVAAFSGPAAESVSSASIMQDAGPGEQEPVEEISFTSLFDRLTTEKEWFGESEKEIAKKFLALQRLLEENLRDLKVFRVGRVGITIFVVGIDPEGFLKGVTTRAVET